MPPTRVNIASVVMPLWVGIADTRVLLMVLPCIDALVLDLEPIIFGDLNRDSVVGFADLIALLSGWGSCLECPTDLAGNGAVGFTDLVILPFQLRLKRAQLLLK